MIIVKLDKPRPADLVHKVAFQWIGKVRWLPHIGQPYFIVGYRDEHVIGVPMAETNKAGQTTYIHIKDLALACDPEGEFDTVHSILANYRTAKSRIEQNYASMLRQLAPKKIEIPFIDRKPASPRPRTRPVYPPDPLPLRHSVAVAA